MPTARRALSEDLGGARGEHTAELGRVEREGSEV